MENNEWQPPVNPPAFPTPAEFRAEAREALKGNWKIALGILALITLIVTVITEGMLAAGNQYLIPLNNNSIEIDQLVSAIIWFIAFAAVTIVVSPLSMIAFSRISRKAVIGEKIDFSLARISVKELLRGVRVTLVVAWRAILIPMLAVCAVLTVNGVFAAKLPEVLGNILIYGSAAAAIVWMACRSVSYLPVYQLMVISPDAKARELADQSRDMMQGHRLRLVGLNLSFFGWMLLFAAFQEIGEKLLSYPGALTALTVFGYVCTFVRLPLDLYMQTAMAAFTKDLLER